MSLGVWLSFTLKGSGSSVRGLMGSDVVLLEGLTSLCKERTLVLKTPCLKPCATSLTENPKFLVKMNKQMYVKKKKTFNVDILIKYNDYFFC